MFQRFNKFLAAAEIFLVISLMFAFLISFSSPNVYAEEEQVCCERDNSGNFCSYVPAGDCTGAGVLKASTSCDQTTFCKPGCCAGVDGFCYSNYPRALCEKRYNGSYSSDASCNTVNECNLGCCLIGTQAAYVTKNKCIQETSAFPNLEVDFRTEVSNEQECLNLAKNTEKGCCVKSDGCSYGTKAECSVASVVNGTGFYKETFCSELRNNCDCAPANPELRGNGDFKSTTCLSNDDKVYWRDSCGNPEGVVKSGLSRYGGVLNSGNCDYNTGTLCGDSDNDGVYVCESLDCEGGTSNIENNNNLSVKQGNYDGRGTPLNDGSFGLAASGILNGESWCEFDSSLQEQINSQGYPSTAGRSGKDPVGSRYYRHLCINGQELVEPCKDLREEYCYYNTLDVNVNGTRGIVSKKYTESRCVKNEWQPCVNECNTANPSTMSDREYKEALKKDQQCCFSSKRDCFWTGNKCTPAVSPGFKFWEGEGSDICGRANTQCTATFVCGGWNSLLGLCESGGEQTGAGFALGGTAGLGAGIGTALTLGAGVAAPPVAVGAVLAALAVGLSAGSAGWTIVSGSECLSQDYLQAANNYCRSLGDCGADYNYLKNYGADDKFTLSYSGFSNTENINGELAAYARDEKDDDLQKTKSVKGRGDVEFSFRKDSNDPVPGNLTKPDWERGGDFFNFDFKKEGPGNKWARAFVTGDDIRGQGWWTSPLGVAGIGLATGIAGAALGSVGVFSAGGGLALGARVSPLGFLVTSGIRIIAGKELSRALTLGAARNQVGEEAAANSFSGIMTGVSAAMWAYTIYQVGDVLLEDTKQETISSTCQPWQPPVYRTIGDDDPCQKCNPDYKPGESSGYVNSDQSVKDTRAFKVCSEYRCKSLGPNCELINKGTTEETCVGLNKLDTAAPKIEPWPEAFTLNVTKNEISTTPTGFKVTKEIPIYSSFIIGLKTDEPSQCKMSLNHSNRYESMGNNFFGTNTFKYFHLNTMAYPASKGLTQEGGITLLGGGHYELYLRCIDASGNANEADYVIEFDVSEEPDLTAPAILGSSVTPPIAEGLTNPIITARDVYLMNKANYTDISLFVNEPAECRYSYVPLDFNIMNTTNSCKTRTAGIYNECRFIRGVAGGAAGIGPAPSGFVSDPGLVQYIYFKCKDHPEAGYPQDKRNFNKDAYTIILRGSQPLTIENLNPSGTIKTSNAIINVTLQVKTSGGALINGNSICKYTTEESSKDNIAAMTEFLNTNSSTHTQPWQPSSGQQKFYVGCYDLAGNRDFAEINFDVERDVTPPQIVKMYRDESFSPPQFTVELNEPGECKDSIEGIFNYETEGNLMNSVGTNRKIFTSTVPDSNVYYVICKDEFSNIMSPAIIQIAEV